MKLGDGQGKGSISKYVLSFLVATSIMVICVGCVVSKDMATVFTRSDQDYKLYPGPVLDDSQLATLLLGDGVGVILIDGLMFSAREYASAKLLPGNYHLNWGVHFGVSVLVDSSGQGEANIATAAQFNAGRTYIAKFERTHGPGYQTYLWLEDLDSGEVVAGVSKP
jgi:hypothetical protein